MSGDANLHTDMRTSRPTDRGGGRGADGARRKDEAQRTEGGDEATSEHASARVGERGGEREAKRWTGEAGKGWGGGESEAKCGRERERERGRETSCAGERERANYILTSSEAGAVGGCMGERGRDRLSG